MGTLSNLVLYLLYILFTYAGLGYKLAMTLMYLIGVIQTFFFNKRWSFEFNKNNHPTFIRYVITYVVVYFANLLALYFLVDRMGMPHQLVQGGMIIVFASVLFLVQRYWIFADISQAKMSTAESP